MTDAKNSALSPVKREAVPTEPGTASLGSADFEALEEGRITRAELASRCGVSRQAIAKWVKNFRNLEGSAPTVPAKKSGGRGGVSKPVEFTADDASRLAVSAAFSAVVAVEKSLRETTLGPSAIKAAVTALGDAVAILERFQVVAPPEEHERLPALSIRRMSDKDEAAIRAANDEEE